VPTPRFVSGTAKKQLPQFSAKTLIASSISLSLRGTHKFSFLWQGQQFFVAILSLQMKPAKRCRPAFHQIMFHAAMGFSSSGAILNSENPPSRPCRMANKRSMGNA